ncbi:MAG: LPS export ABC transporter periplasmic protein LptC [Bacteroidales bacterium]|nr:LPS export ABC transporter periplasmic protein LptC [Bacteroidales bacterium]
MRPPFGAGFYRVALLFLGATLFISCKDSIEKTDALGAIDSISTQTVRNMRGIETKFGKVSIRLEAPLMETYSLLAEPFEIFPQGIRIEGYTPEGELESEITAKMAIHKTKSNQERWEAYGNVVIINHIKNETLKTDTLYWDRVSRRIYTHAFVRLLSPQGMLQGYGMESDERASDATILNPFDSYGIMARDTL